MSSPSHTLYINEKDVRRIEEICENLRKKRVYGIFKADGSINKSAFLRYLLNNIEKTLKNEQELHNNEEIDAEILI